MLNESQELDFVVDADSAVDEEVILHPLTDEDVEWIEGVLDTAADLNIELTAEAINDFFVEAHRNWHAKTAAEREDPTGYIATAGVLAGQLIVEAHDGDWVMLELPEGNQPGILDPVSESILVPLDTVAEIWFGEIDLSVAEFIEECLSDTPDYDNPAAGSDTATGGCNCGCSH